MCADRGRQILVTRIDDFEAQFQIGILDGVTDLEPERERINGAGRVAIDQRKPARRRALLHPIEPIIPRKAVLLHRIGFSPMPVFIIFHASDDRKQHR